MVTINGIFTPAFQPVAEALSAQLNRPASAHSGGASVCVYHRGIPVVDIWGGTRNAEGQPWDADTTALSFSTTKGVLAALLHRLVDRGLLDYDDPVSRYWPEFAQAGKEAITIRQVLSHQAGLHAVRPLIQHAEQMLDWTSMTEALAAASAKPDHAGRSSYHALTFGWLAGEIVRRITKSSVNEALQTELSTPLSLDGASIGVPAEERHRLATLLPPESPGASSPFVRTGRALATVAFRAAWRLLGLDPAQFRDTMLPEGGSEFFYNSKVLNAEIPAANGVFTARSLARVYAIFAGGGVLDGRRFLSDTTVARAVEVQSRKRDTVIGLPMHWRLGFHRVWSRRDVLPRAFGHFGYGGSGAWADPDRNLAVAMTLNRVAGTPVGDGRMLRISSLAVRCADAA